MSQRPPALLTLLGLAATAGCQGGDTLRTILAKAPPARPDAMHPVAQGVYRMLPRRNERCLASTLQAGLAELQRRAAGQGWERRALTASQLRHVLGAPVIDELASKTGLSETDLLARLARGLPVTVALMQSVDAVLPPQMARAAERRHVANRC